VGGVNLKSCFGRRGFADSMTFDLSVWRTNSNEVMMKSKQHEKKDRIIEAACGNEDTRVLWWLRKIFALEVSLTYFR
jgi:hypothetical protein